MTIAASEPYLILEVETGAPVDPGAIGAGTRRMIPLLGGTVRGAIEGEVLPGTDWQTIHDDGNVQIGAHYAFRTTSGAVVEVVSNGVRSGPPEVLARLMAGEFLDPSTYYFRTAIRFQTSAPELAHLNFKLFVARGGRRKGGVTLEVFEIL